MVRWLLASLHRHPLACFAAALISLGGVGVVGLWAMLPDIGALERYRPPLPSLVVDRHGTPIGSFVEQRRQLIALRDLPPHVVDAFLAAEDSGFYRHFGFDPLAALRASWVNLRERRVAQGGSTITQQLAKNLFLSPERTLLRKLRDVALAVRIELELEKDEILELYLNQIYLGSGAYGVAEAAQTYFAKEIGAVSVSEAALLAGLPRAPSRLSPHADPAAADAARRGVIERMRETGRLGPQAAALALTEVPRIVAPPPPPGTYLDAAYFVEEVRQQLFDELGAEAVLRGGLRIETTLDSRLQREAVDSVRSGLEQVRKRTRQATEGALISLEVKSGEVLALVGGYDFARSRFNRAVQARRQPGSAFKPFAYGAALAAGFAPNATLYDYQVEFRDAGSGRLWRPKNYRDRFRGPVSMSEAFARSLNNATIRLVEEVGVDPVIDFARRAGIRSPLQRDLGLALGTSEVTLLEITSAYGAFAGGGRAHDPILVRRVLDAEGNVLRHGLVAADLPPRETQREIRAVDAYLTTYLMREAVRAWYGTGHAAAKLGPSIAGKTGSTNDNRDAWFIGFSPDIATGVWVGNDDRAPMARDHTGAVAALPIWIAFMQDALRGQEPEEFPIPGGLRFAGIDPETGGWIRSRVHYPGWVPIAANRKARYAKFVPAPWPEEEEPVASIAMEAYVAERAPGGASTEGGLGTVGAGPPGADPVSAERAPSGQSEAAPAAVEQGRGRSE